MQPGASAIIAISEALDVSTDYILKGIEPDYFSQEEKELINAYRRLTEREKGRIDEILSLHREDNNKWLKEGNLSYALTIKSRNRLTF